jgi:glycosyltransferase involved in cell wall biosynthesis
MPTLNAAATLERALGSTAAQTLEDWELICVDNGSADDTVPKLRESACHDSRISILSEPTRGAGPARNKGLCAARGRFLAFLDADDQFAAASTLATLVEHATRSRVKICGGSLRVQLPDGSAVEDFGDFNRPFRFERNEALHYRDYQFDYGFYRFIYDRKLLESAGINFPHYKRFQDPPFFVRSMLASETFFALQEDTYVHFYGHQSVNWDETAIHDLLCGLTDNLRASRVACLEGLHRLTVDRFLHEYADKIKLSTGPLAQRALARCLSAIDIGLLSATQKSALLHYHRGRLSPCH